ncbi:growth arrest and DNA damage-inducible protein GADD45 alpha-like [Corticium candelabrum]|uniref:growth arrest and DNA damage-inducible protein GADD45 alpha-like n=1 Tax=Corticium candelabrum TaxID=121492 RepID=UPI002E275D4E|nr:growth arrest and DNA damage-inducible protein GADD45 alpha-like [Corticium candelabrum]
MTRARRASSVRLDGLRKVSVGSMLSDCVRHVLTAARDEANLICGVGAVAEALESDVDAALCVLATGDSELSDPAVQIYFKLIEAFCIEYGVHLLKVDSSLLLAKWTRQSSVKSRARRGCVLITGDKYSKALAILRSYCMQEGGFVSKSSLRLRERVEAESEIGVGNSCVE